MIASTCIVWLARGRKAAPVSAILPGDTTSVQLTRPVILFAVLRAAARPAPVLARTITSLSTLSGGRILLSIGAGGSGT